jgi:hypothetical protein
MINHLAVRGEDPSTGTGALGERLLIALQKSIQNNSLSCPPLHYSYGEGPGVRPTSQSPPTSRTTLLQPCLTSPVYVYAPLPSNRLAPGHEVKANPYL